MKAGICFFNCCLLIINKHPKLKISESCRKPVGKTHIENSTKEKSAAVNEDDDANDDVSLLEAVQAEQQKETEIKQEVMEINLEPETEPVAEIKAEIIEEDDNEYFISNNSTQCQICDEMCDTTKLDMHKKYHLMNQKSSIYACARCPRQFAAKSQIRNHIRWHLLEDQRQDKTDCVVVRICEFCGMQFSTDPGLCILFSMF